MSIITRKTSIARKPDEQKHYSLWKYNHGMDTSCYIDVCHLPGSSDRHNKSVKDFYGTHMIFYTGNSLDTNQMTVLVIYKQDLILYT